ncbi:cbb3-type cytochrome c oxidase subunit I [Roseateles sp. BYS180W]|uniref:Cbb3-type cytochrome c oxidase subunit I n=1 Tax=Roseateles rivi TaxID=3299028 RepID=A0ABW7FRP6_9BURK
MDSTLALLFGSFVLSLLGLLAFVGSMRHGLLVENPRGAGVIFEPGEQGHVDDPLAAQRPHAVADLHERLRADRSSAMPVFMLILAACFWLLLGTGAGLVASLKLHMPDWLVAQPWLSFGRIRTVHLNAVIYGWSSNACLAVVVWLLPRLLRTPLVGSHWVTLGAGVFNAGVAAGIGAIAAGVSDGMEFLEIPWQIGIFLVVGLLLIVASVLRTLVRRRTEHLYVSAWYFISGLLWISLLYVVAKIPNLHTGVQQATMNWWFGHNALGLWFTPVSVGAIYYFLPKIIGRPVQSYNLSLLGFWTLAFFYGQVGGHHLIGGPVPGWLTSLSIVQSIMMIVPVVAFSVNQIGTMKGHWHVLRRSPTLRFMAFGALMYMLSSLEGSLEALRSVNTVTHFTHFTVAHAHLGMYGFVSMVMFGAFYYMLPRVLSRDWPRPGLVTVHFVLASAGILLYVVALSIGGWLQGLAMLDAARPFVESVTLTQPYLQARSVAGVLLTLSHLVFVWHVLLLLGRRPEPATPPATPVAPAAGATHAH